MIVHWICRCFAGRPALFVGLLIGLLSILSIQASASEKDRYIQSVVSLLRLHADAIRQLASQEFKYSRNLARHAAALQHTFGLLGPMDWHAAKADFMQKKREDGHNQPADIFEKTSEQCQKHMKVLQQTALQHVESGGSPMPVLKALDDVQGTCNACHDLLNGAAPDVWGR
ncbi:MAG: cytochrome c [Magnetococcus sp. DMHC-8]